MKAAKPPAVEAAAPEEEEDPEIAPCVVEFITEDNKSFVVEYGIGTERVPDEEFEDIILCPICAEVPLLLPLGSPGTTCPGTTWRGTSA